MKLYGLAYHDVVPLEAVDSSGFSGGLAARYKVTPDLIHEHFERFAMTVSNPPSTIDEPLPPSKDNTRWVLTFDDGGISAYERAAVILGRFGWHGHFFVITDRIGKPGYLTKEQIGSLRARGHIIGSHTCSHPYPIASQSLKSQYREWNDSIAILSDILGEAVISGAIPGGGYTKQVAVVAGKAGIRYLFTLEPRARPWLVADCRVIGRYLIRRNTTPDLAAAFAAGKPLRCAAESLFWNARKLPKIIGGRYYEELKKAVVSRTRI